MTEPIELKIDGKVAQVILSRPERRNAFDTEMLTAYEDAITALGRHRGLEVAVLRAEGPAFCSGTDLKQLEQLTPADTLHWQRRTAETIERWSRLEATTISVFGGPAIGSGAIIGLVSDLRLATPEALITFPEVGLGIPLTWGGVPVLNALLGPDRTRRLLLLGERLGAEEMCSLDLVMKVAAAEEIEAETQALVARLLESPQLGRLMTKRAVAAAAAAPGFVTAAYEPFLASLSVIMREGEDYGLAPGSTSDENG